ncbi:MAG: hypothetical protein L6R38_001839 [Xanthoria sp. 2 TBL-2021]|nr:MAG: hypothetical protein L6R38_001839 [Xanthoria sp. 2 TBL-2021]
MKSLTIIIGTAALAIHGVAGAALPVDVLKRKGPALLDHEILERSESYCGPWGLCSWGDHGPICCDFPPGNTIGTREEKTSNVERGDMKSTFSAEDDENADGDENAKDEDAVDGKFVAV